MNDYYREFTEYEEYNWDLLHEDWENSQNQLKEAFIPYIELFYEDFYYCWEN